MTRLAAEGVNAPQIEYWNSEAGDRWATTADTQDVMIGGMGDAAMAACDLQPGQRVLDIGCGSGATSLQIAARVGAEGSVLGIDVSTPMLEVAEQRRAAASLDHVRFENRDAATYAFPEAAFDRFYSRFGVMFFLDPAAAFANMRPALRDGGLMAFVCWQPRTDNQWMTVPFEVGLRHVPAPPPAPPTAPGPTAFGDPDHVRNVLTAGGFGGIEIDPIVLPIQLGADLDTAVERLVALGPAGRLLKGADDATIQAVAADMAEAVSPFAGPDGVTMEGRAWIVRGTAA